VRTPREEAVQSKGTRRARGPPLDFVTTVDPPLDRLRVIRVALGGALIGTMTALGLLFLTHGGDDRWWAAFLAAMVPLFLRRASSASTLP
jgi:hypothetical protein